MYFNVMYFNVLMCILSSLLHCVFKILFSLIFFDLFKDSIYLSIDFTEKDEKITDMRRRFNIRRIIRFRVSKLGGNPVTNLWERGHIRPLQ